MTVRRVHPQCYSPDRLKIRHYRLIPVRVNVFAPLAEMADHFLITVAEMQHPTRIDRGHAGCNTVLARPVLPLL